MQQMLPKTWFAFLTRIFVIFFIIISLISLFPSANSKADELSDLNSKIQQKEREKSDTLKKIGQIESTINSLLSQKSTIESKKNLISELTGQKTSLDNEVIKLDAQIRDQENAINDYSKKLAEGEGDIQEETNFLYKLSFQEPKNIFAGGNKLEDYFENWNKTNASISFVKQRISVFKEKIEEVTKIKAQVAEEKDKTARSKADIDQKISAIQGDVNKYNQQLSSASITKSALNTQLGSISSQLQGLTAKQAELLQAELAKMNLKPQVEHTNIVAGTYYFAGRGRDKIDGHGLGMSQWGAYGMAQAGWTYDKILTFYYTGTVIGDYQEPDKIIVDGKTNGPISFDDYLAGIGETPNSWPAESIKAQIVAARTYAMRAAYKGSDGIMHICGTDACQVYVGGTAKMAYVSATKGKVILYNGQPISAYFSASHRGYSSSLNAVWGATDLPYIKPVNDEPYAYKDYTTDNPYYNPNSSDPYYSSKSIKPYYWQWSTNGYTAAQLTDIFSRNSATSVGTFKSISLQRDSPGKRVARITITGTSGSKTLTGWDFRAIFNNSTPFNDYVYSTEFAFFQK